MKDISEAMTNGKL